VLTRLLLPSYLLAHQLGVDGVAVELVPQPLLPLAQRAPARAWQHVMSLAHLAASLPRIAARAPVAAAIAAIAAAGRGPPNRRCGSSGGRYVTTCPRQHGPIAAELGPGVLARRRQRAPRLGRDTRCSVTAGIQGCNPL
jgi:hypothetical protein